MNFKLFAFIFVNIFLFQYLILNLRIETTKRYFTQQKQNKMKTLESKTHVISELKKAGIQICLSRTTSHNSFNLVYESYGFFAVNAIDGTSFELVQNFNKIYSNINICIGN